MEKKIVRRKVADKTRDKILKAARKLFAKNGFSATSTLSIANAANVNETLLFHHFGNKEKLWKMVKASVVEEIQLAPLNLTPPSLAEFLQEAIEQRLSAYQHRPELIRLLQWQQMEAKQDKLTAGNALAPVNWLPAIQYLQETAKIKASIQPEFILIWLTASINTIILDQLSIFQDKKNYQHYLDFLIEGFIRVLSP